MTSTSKDLIVLGSGPGGYVAAIRAAQNGRQVTIVEREALGGICLNWGCIPSKALLRSAQLYHDMKRASDFGFQTDGLKLDFPKIIGRSRDVAGKLSSGVNFLMKKNKIEVLMGTGSLEGSNRLTVRENSGNTTTLSYKDIIIATGARPRPLPGVEIDGEVIHTYRTILDYRRLPQKMLIIGAGAVGIEFAYFFSTLGVQVTVVEMLDQILPLEDTEVSQQLQRIFVKNGMVIKTSTAVSDIKRSGKVISATLKGKSEEEKWSGDCCLVAIGFMANVENIGLEKAGVKVDRGFIKVDEFMRTNVPNHFAIGDVVGAPQLAHVASHEGIIAADAAAGKTKHPMSYDNVPGCTYCQPQVASVGLTEKALKERGIKYKVGKVPFAAIGKAIAIGEQDGFIKVLIDPDVGEVLGVHILHSEATELISEAAVIRSHEGVAASVVDTIHPHPTLSESVMEAMALAMGRPINV
ncbi:MAG: dihydrolipoyl dehydrogenase [Deltaproteobacteria bacterium]|nr:dihydrolipoyl dehydrogenase [Deltaproteobacteria bacterium]